MISDRSHAIVSGFAGYRIIEDPTLLNTDPDKADWSRCRSPSRARRRWARGKRFQAQHVVWGPLREAIVGPGGTMVMHPALAQALRRELARRSPKQEGRAFGPTL